MSADIAAARGRNELAEQCFKAMEDGWENIVDMLNGHLEQLRAKIEARKRTEDVGAAKEKDFCAQLQAADARIESLEVDACHFRAQVCNREGVRIYIRYYTKRYTQHFLTPYTHVCGAGAKDTVQLEYETRTIENTRYFLTPYTHVGGAGAKGRSAFGKRDLHSRKYK